MNSLKEGTTNNSAQLVLGSDKNENYCIIKAGTLRHKIL